MKNKFCITCGRMFTAFDSWEKECYSCKIESERRTVKEAILSGETTETHCEQDIICPWCGETIEPDCECREAYEDGEHEFACPECDKVFCLETTVSYSYSTKRELPAWMEREKKLTELYRNSGNYSNEEFIKLRNAILNGGASDG